MEATQANQTAQTLDFTDPLRVTATCRECHRQIKPGEYRVVVVVAEILDADGSDSGRHGNERRSSLAFCKRCMWRNGVPLDHFAGGRHPLMRVFFGPTAAEISRDLAIEEHRLKEWADEAKLQDAERQAKEKQLAMAVESGDMRTVEFLLPVRDADPREVSLDRLADQRMEQLGVRAVDVKAKIMAESEGDAFWGHRISVPGEATTASNDGPRLMAAHLASPKAFTLRPFQRSVGELWSKGLTQNEIAERLKSSQATVCRAIQSLKVILHVAT